MKIRSLKILDETFAVARLSPDAPIPDWVFQDQFVSITRTLDELSIVCPAARIPDGLLCEDGWKCIKIEGPLDFSQIGILASLATVLADADISIFVLSTFDTDYLLIKAADLSKGIDALTAAGHRVAG